MGFTRECEGVREVGGPKRWWSVCTAAWHARRDMSAAAVVEGE